MTLNELPPNPNSVNQYLHYGNFIQPSQLRGGQGIELRSLVLSSSKVTTC